MILLDRSIKQHEKKVIQKITSDSFSKDSLMMCHEIVISFTDGTEIVLRNDWRGDECYISEYEKQKKIKRHPKVSKIKGRYELGI